MQLLRALQIWAFYINGCGRCTAKKGGVRWSRPSDEATNLYTDDEVLQKQGRQHCPQLALLCLTSKYQRFLSLSGTGVACWNAWVQAINNRMGMDSVAACVHIVPRHVKWNNTLLQPRYSYRVWFSGTSTKEKRIYKTYWSLYSYWYKCQIIHLATFEGFLLFNQQPFPVFTCLVTMCTHGCGPEFMPIRLLMAWYMRFTMRRLSPLYDRDWWYLESKWLLNRRQ